MSRAAATCALLAASAVAGPVASPLVGVADSTTGVHRFSLTRRVFRTGAGPNATAPLGLERGRRVQDEVPVYGDYRALAYYYSDVYVGTPPKRFTVITDTGA